ncbi:CPBP family intramembrane glutamic endopeptidase [Aminipila sp.]|uniref:CPBP family intramembrane glutamic endopeptidase n=1 Tax=Aminipila sp. TaxID=2060095 RepID=UPI00289F3619|nr:type II CAAX endopeptidase family protein [Aminipila sp.]
MKNCMMKNNALNYEYGKIKLLELVGIYMIALVLGVLFRIYGGSIGILLSGTIFYFLPLMWIIIKLKTKKIPFQLWTARVNKFTLYDSFFVAIFFISISVTFIIIEAILFKEGQMEYEKVSWQKVIVLAVLAPITEELICRGVILQSFVNKYSVRKAVWLSAIVFYIIHINIFNLLTIFAGVMFAVLMIKHCNLYMTMAIHFFWNLILQLKPLLIARLHNVSSTVCLCMLLLCFFMIIVGLIKSIQQYKFILKEYCE